MKTKEQIMQMFDELGEQFNEIEQLPGITIQEEIKKMVAINYTRKALLWCAYDFDDSKKLIIK